ncbi:hypothetical protein [Marivivens marinus]|uniref:hypothetical protein n=1 Tax=Marivivens marinus TaxID=3110173 RepID=UPI003B847442
MSNPESFIDEVTEEVRRDQLFAYFKKYGWIAAVLVVGLVGGAAWTEYQRATSAAAAQAKGDAIYAALSANESADRVAALADLPSGVATAFLLAAEQQNAGDAAASAETLRALANDAEVAPIYRDIAGFKAVLAEVGTTAPADRITALEPLARPGAPLSLLAQEQIALARIEMGEVDAALADLRAIREDAGATRGLRDRAGGLIVALGGELELASPAEVAGTDQ